MSDDIADDQFEVKVTVTIGVPYRGEYPSCREVIDSVVEAFVSPSTVPPGSRLYKWEARVCEPKELRRRARKLARIAGQDVAPHHVSGDTADA